MLHTVHSSASVSWELWSRPPAPALGPHVLGYVGYRERVHGTPFRRLETPSDEVHVILSLGPAIRANGVTLRSFVAAPDTAHSVVESHEGEQHCLELRLSPLGARLILGVPMHELACRTVPFEDVWGDHGLVERLAAQPSWEARFALLDAVLSARLAAADPLAPEVEGAWRRLVATAGAVPVAELAREAGWSRRHFTARFADAAGLTPKAFARVLRFGRAKALLDAGRLTLADLALECGYYDQAHLNRDFRAFAGCTPTELVARRLPAGYAAGPQVTSVQDGARTAA